MAENLFKVGNIISTVSSLVQTSILADESLHREQSEHQREIDIVKGAHDREILLLKQNHLLKQFTDVERHFQQLNSDLLSTNRECERDMYDQRNQYCQSSIIASSIMLSALVSVVVEGVLPSSQNSQMKGIYVIYSISLTLSLLCLFVCLIIYLIVIKISSENMSEKSNTYNKLVEGALKESLKNDPSAINDFVGSEEEDTKIEEWLNQEKEQLKGRRDINLKIQTELGILGKKAEDKAFDNFWEKECRDLERKGLHCFYFGTLFFLIAIAIYMYVIFQKVYFTQGGVIGSLVPIGMSVGGGFYIIYYFDALNKKQKKEWDKLLKDPADAADPAGDENT